MAKMAEAQQITTNKLNALTVGRFKELVRSQRNSLDAYLAEVETHTKIDNTKTKTHIHHLRIDGNNKVRVKDFCERLAIELVYYCIPRSEFAEAFAEQTQADQGRKIIQMHKKASRLFTDLEKTGEGGEIMLYLLTENYLRIPQILCKMPLKTSTSMHYHGADGVHGMYESKGGKLALYWGESKLYKDATDAISACFESLAPFVTATGGGESPQRRDIELLSDNLDLNDTNLESAILRYLDPDDPHFNKLEYRGVALVGFDSDHYINEVSEAALSKAIKQAASKWRSSVGNHVANKVLQEVVIELFCLPLPSVENFREAFLKELRQG